MARRKDKGALGAVIVVCALGALYPIGSALAQRAQNATSHTTAAASIEPAGVEADVIVTLRAGTLTLTPPGLREGMTTLYLVNKTGVKRVVTLTGPGLTRARTVKLAPGRNATLKVRLKQGSYKVSASAGAGRPTAHQLTVRQATTAPTDNGSTNQPPDGWWEMCENI